MEYKTFSTEKNGAILTVRFSIGEVNIMTAAMAGELFGLVRQLKVDTETKVVVFESANPDFFIAHFDVGDILKLIDGDAPTPAGNPSELNVLQSLGLAIHNLPQVTIAKVDGACRGGGFEFVLALDMCFASGRSRFCFPEAASGFLPAGGGTTLLPLKAGRSRALEIMLTSRDFSAAEAVQYNFVNRVFATGGELDDYVATTAGQIAARDAAVIRAIKSVVRTTAASKKEGLLAGMAEENSMMNQCISDPRVLSRLRTLNAGAGTRETELDLPASISALLESEAGSS